MLIEKHDAEYISKFQQRNRDRPTDTLRQYCQCY